MKYDYDLLVIGSGSAGFSAAHAAKGQGRKIGIVEADRLGGECPNWACVPTKALLKSAKVYRDLLQTQMYGVTSKDVTADFVEIMKRRGQIVGALGGSRIEKIADKLGIDVLHGFATFLDAHTVQIDDKQVTSDKFVIATGSSTFVPEIPGIDQVAWIGFKEAVTFDALPESMTIIGGGPVGCELALIYASFGTRVTIIQHAGALLNREEPEISELVANQFAVLNIHVELNAEVIRVEKAEKGTQTKVRVGKEMKIIKSQVLVLATGKKANTAGLGCQAAGVQLDARGNVLTNSELVTSAQNIWAAGDVDGGMLFTHTAHYEGSLAGANAFAKTPRQVDERVVPRVTFVDPEVASVGMTEAEVREKYGTVLVGTFYMRGLGRAYIDGNTKGFVKLVADPKTRKLLGGHIVSERAGELIHEVALAIHLKARMDDLAEMIHAYPTYSEAVAGAATMAEVV
ncbi:hypothetical protein COV06_01235 [Candidatus Uhrbacteria bacterium CG10_big_fil_rev_8_21_14_0_10_50_16]|uniref:Dihydrolipoyl dehydrogenase n=1 Tax=Candidatus Uhrbacteria bacterium CG10_big_fil_rev_8_21_14_0_10_50_16 TaxID=1975039 RepID=A0A2H0RQH2_9BACT|nr:MAG: hypothetical protein COV06_01235 [Candidatus Uhrbacteria bacterium CG10_big_fil_rev_8_21_14_0_10_50_16]